MRRSLRSKIGAWGAALVLATTGTVGVVTATTGVASATTTTGCAIGQFPMIEGGQSDLNLACVIKSEDGSNAELINDYTNAFWHGGAARVVKGSVTSSSGGVTTFSTTSTVNLAGTHSTLGGTSGDENRSVTAGIGKLPVRSFVKSEGTGTITIQSPPTELPATLPIGASFNLAIENGPGRSVEDASISGSTVTSATANFVSGTYSGAIGSTTLTGDVGLSISGPGIPQGDTIASVISATQVTLTNAATASSTGSTISIGDETRTATHRAVNDLAVNGATITSASANFKQTDVGLLVKGTGIPGNAYIASVTNSTTATLNVNGSPTTAAPAAGIFGVIGLQSATAPVKDGVDGAATLETELVLNPALVAGVPNCSDGVYAGQDISGVWNSPSKMYLKGTSKDPIFFNDQGMGLVNRTLKAQQQLTESGGTNNPIIGQIKFKTSVVEFAAYVVEKPNGNADIEFPFVPTALGVCPGQPIITKFVFNGTFLSSANNPTGYGKGGTAGLRGLAPLNAAGSSLVFGTQPAQAHLQNWTADTIASATLATHGTADTLTWNGGDQAGHAESLIDGQEINIQCGLGCSAVGLKVNTPYYVNCSGGSLSCAPGGDFKLSSKPFNTAASVPITLVNIKIDSTTGASYNVYDSKPFFSTIVGGTNQTAANVHFANGPIDTQDSPSCSIVRPPDNTNNTTAFPCPSK